MQRLYIAMYTSAEKPVDTAVTLYCLSSERRRGKLCLHFVRHFHDKRQKKSIPTFAVNKKEKCLFYFNHKVGLTVFERVAQKGRKQCSLKNIGGPPHQIAGYFYTVEAVAVRYCESLLVQVLDSSYNERPLKSRRELNRASVLRRLFAQMYPNQIVLNKRDLKAFIHQ